MYNQIDSITNEEIGQGYINADLREYEDGIQSMADLSPDDLALLMSVCED